jgi:ketosteroid isomerase-like protein
MEIDNPEVRADLERAFWQYVDAIVANDIDAVTAAFWDSGRALRYGPGEQLYGKAAIAAFRKTQRGRRLDLEVTRLELTTFGDAFGTANCEMRRSDSDGVGRMSHTWVRFPEGWRIVAAHVSNAAPPAI